MEQELRALLEQRKPDGTPRFSDAEVRAVIPVLAMAVARAVPDVVFPRFVMDLVGQVALKAGVKSEATPQEVTAALSRFYVANPLPPQLVSALEKLLAGQLTSMSAEAARTVAQLMGGSVKLQPLESGPRPDGTVRAGPSARFAAMAFVPKDKKKT